MSRDIKDLHPELQDKWNQLLSLCASKGIYIKNSECLRTVAEQDTLYAQGRTQPGKIVTNAKGSSYSSQHQWGIAVDFYLDMDIDGDGAKSDDAFNNLTRIFDKVGTLAKSIGLAWGGDWKSPVDKPHLYLPYWGSTTSQLKSKYGTPASFKSTWGNTNSPSALITPTSKSYLSKGDSGTDVKQLQIMLNACGYNCGKTDGIFGSGTETAMKNFQKANGLTVDGKYGNASKAKLTALYNKPKGDEWVRRLQSAIGANVDGIAGSNTLSRCPMLKKDSKGTTVFLLQERLGNTFRIGVVGGFDGKFGTGTYNAVVEFQRQNGLIMDGIVGKNTWKKLLKL